MEPKDRPIIAITKPRWEVIVDVVLFIVGILFVIYLVTQWVSIPQRVPVHFKLNGEADRWGDKWMLIIPILLGIGLWIGLTILQRYPHKYNYINLTSQNAERQYRNARRIVYVLKIEITVLMFNFSWMGMQDARGEHVSNYFMIFSPIVIVLTIVFFLLRSERLK